jgi:lysozyme
MGRAEVTAMKINQATIDLVKRWEGFEPVAYQCSAGRWTIGYGITAKAGIGVDPKPGMRVTQEQADAHLRLALDRFAAQIWSAITAPINENEFGAFLSLAYNIGPDAFRGSSALRHFNAGDKVAAAKAMRLWNKATVGGKRRVLQGLVNRREDEVRLFQTPVRPAEAPSREHQHPILALLARIFGGRT